jgi:hypothetical protein
MTSKKFVKADDPKFIAAAFEDAKRDSLDPTVVILEIIDKVTKTIDTKVTEPTTKFSEDKSTSFSGSLKRTKRATGIFQEGTNFLAAMHGPSKGEDFSARMATRNRIRRTQL